MKVDNTFKNNTEVFDCSKFTLSFEEDLNVDNDDDDDDSTLSFSTAKYILSKYGCVIITDVVSVNECDQLISGVYDFVEKITSNFEKPFNRHDQSTWGSLSKLALLHNMMYQNYQAGHCDASWEARKNKNIQRIWSNLIDTPVDRLISSFCAFAFQIAPEKMNNPTINCNASTTYASKGFLKKKKIHCDQKFTDDRLLFQSLFTAIDVDPGDATFRCLLGGHSMRADALNKFPILSKQKTNFNFLDKSQIDWYEANGAAQKFITCPKGSIIIWDSKLPHSAAEPHAFRSIPRDRLVFHLCYDDCNNLSDKELEKRIKFCVEKKTTPHINIPISSFPPVSRYFILQNRSNPPQIPHIKFHDFLSEDYKLIGLRAQTDIDKFNKLILEREKKNNNDGGMFHSVV